MKKGTLAPAAVLALGLLVMPPASIAVDAVVGAVARFVPTAAGSFGLMSPAWAEPGALSKKQSEALEAYEKAVKNFEQVLGERRAQIASGQALPNLPGQALYLARNAMIGARKDLTDALPSKIGRPNKFKIPPAYFDADNEPLLDEYTRLFGLMQAPPAGAQNSSTPFKDVADLAIAIARAGDSMPPMRRRQAGSGSGCSLPRPTAIKTSETRARIPTREVFRPARRRTSMAGKNGRRSSLRSQPSIPR